MPRPIQDAAFARGLAHLRKYAVREGHARVPARYLQNGYRLGQWVWVQRVQRKRGRLPAEREAALEAVPRWSWNPRRDRFQDRVELIRRRLRKLPPGKRSLSHRTLDARLGAWISSQRRAFRDRLLSRDRRRALESLPGWSWTPPPPPDTFTPGFERLRRYVRRYGNAQVPLVYRQGRFALGRWVAAVRAAYRVGRLSAQRIAQLERLPGWTWRARDYHWQEALRALRRYARRMGHARAPGWYREGDFPLGRWVAGQRRRYRKKRLSAARIRTLRAFPGWVWDARRRR
jgi:helicase associated protein